MTSRTTMEIASGTVLPNARKNDGHAGSNAPSAIVNPTTANATLPIPSRRQPDSAAPPKAGTCVEQRNQGHVVATVALDTDPPP